MGLSALSPSPFGNNSFRMACPEGLTYQRFSHGFIIHPWLYEIGKSTQVRCW
jgi:hypothetical protein